MDACRAVHVSQCAPRILGSLVMDRVTIERTMKQAAGWPLVSARQSPANLIGSGLAELRAAQATYGFRGVLTPF
jgi:hypothetical protein